MLDTDIFSKWAGREEPVTEHILSQSPDDVFVSIVTIGKAISGWQEEVARCPREELVSHYTSMSRAVQFMTKVVPLPFTESSFQIYVELRRNYKGYDPFDLRVAAIGLEHGLVVVTNNTQDFAPIEASGLKIENWFKHPPGKP